jgi:putative phosphoribosyl transferase
MGPGERRRCVIEVAPRGRIDGDLTVPEQAMGLVVFAHGSGSSRLSPRNRSVAEHLGRHRLATLLMDLLTTDEDEADRATGRVRFDIGLLADRVVRAIDWVDDQSDVATLPLGCFGASTGAAAALVAAAERPERVRAVVSRGGRPDLAGDALGRVRAPTLLLVGGQDLGVMELNAEAATRLATVELRVVPGATHLFDEPGTLEQVQEQAAAWFLRWLPEPPAATDRLDDPGR